MITPTTDWQGGSAPDPTAPRRRLRLRLRADPVIAICVLALLAFPLAAIVGSARQPVRPPALGALTTAAARAPGGALRDLPLVSASDRSAAGMRRLRDAVVDASRRLLGARRAQALLRYAGGPPQPPPAGALPTDYPFRYRGLTRLVADGIPARPDPARAQAASELGGLLALAVDAGALPYGGQVVFAVLDRARAGGACDAQLNLAFVVAASRGGPDRQRARAARRGDRLPARSDRAVAARPVAVDRRPAIRTATPARAGGVRRAAAPRARRVGRLVGQGGRAAADGLHRRGRAQPSPRGTASRARWRCYRRATRSTAPELAAGDARALAGLRRYGQAAREQAAATIAAGRPAALQARLVEYLERAGRFDRPRAEAHRLAAGARFADGPRAHHECRRAQDSARCRGRAGTTVLGAGRLKPVALEIVARLPRGGGRERSRTSRSSRGSGRSPV